MKTLREEIEQFISLSGMTRYRISVTAKVPQVFLSRLKNGKQQDIYSRKADAIRAAMRELDPAAAALALSDDDAVSAMMAPEKREVMPMEARQ